MPRIRLVKPTLAHESAIRAYLDAVRVAGLPLHGAVLELFPDVASWIAFCDAARRHTHARTASPKSPIHLSPPG